MDQFINTGDNGYHLCKDQMRSTYWCAVFEYTASEETPLTLLLDGKSYRPDAHFFTDMRTGPSLVDAFVPRASFLLAFIFHDSICTHGGIWVYDCVTGKWTFVKLTMLEGDEFLRECVRVEGGGRFIRGLIYRVVRMAAPFRSHGAGDQDLRAHGEMAA